MTDFKGFIDSAELGERLVGAAYLGFPVKGYAWSSKIGGAIEDQVKALTGLPMGTPCVWTHTTETLSLYLVFLPAQDTYFLIRDG